VNHSVHTKLNKDVHTTYCQKHLMSILTERYIMVKIVQIQTSSMGYNWCRQRSVTPGTVGYMSTIIQKFAP